MMMSTTPVGIEISGRTVRAAQLRRRRGGWTLHAWAVFPRLEGGVRKPEDEAARIAGVLGRRGFRGVDVVLAAPDDRLLSAVIDLPPRASGAPVDQIAANEMARLFKKDPSRMETALWDLPASGRQSAGNQGMAVACAHEDVEPLVDAFDARGLRVRAICPRMIGMARACMAWMAGEPQVTFILDVGWSVAKLIALRDHAIVSERNIDGGDFARLRADAARHANVPPEIAELLLANDGAVNEQDAGEGEPNRRVARCVDQHAERIAEQINISLAYIGHRYGVGSTGRVLLLGEHGGTPGLAGRIGGLIGAEVRLITPGSIAHAAEGDDEAGAAVSVAVGLALLEREERT